ncbi:MAG: extensin, partial [Mesorhizobium sp.]
MAGIFRAAFVAVRQTRRARMIAGALAIAAISACTTGSVLSLEPAVDVGSQTSAVPKYAGMQSLVPS